MRCLKTVRTICTRPSRRNGHFAAVRPTRARFSAGIRGRGARSSTSGVAGQLRDFDLGTEIDLGQDLVQARIIGGDSPSPRASRQFLQLVLGNGAHQDLAAQELEAIEKILGAVARKRPPSPAFVPGRLLDRQDRSGGARRRRLARRPRRQRSDRGRELFGELCSRALRLARPPDLGTRLRSIWCW